MDLSKIIIRLLFYSRATDISDLKLLEKQDCPSGLSTVAIAKPVAKRVAGRSHSVSESSTLIQNKTKPIDIEVKQPNHEIGTSLYKNGTPNKRDNIKRDKKNWKSGWKDEACFGSPLDSAINKDFDFEKNLALFDKQAVFDEINSLKPDIVRHTDQNRKQSKYRHDENVIAVAPTTYRQISVPKQEICEYVTDDGLVIPSISRMLRNKLWAAADKFGLIQERRMELMGRAATEMALQLLGGGHRLNPRNTHQWPSVVILCGPHKQGAMGINAARQLASHGVNTILYVIPSELEIFKKELALYKLTKNKIVSSVSGLPHVTDLIIIALIDEDNIKTYGNIAEWTNSNRAPVLALDPPANGTPGILTKFSLVPVLPLSHSLENGKIYLCNLSFPQQIFQEVGIKYQSPFGPKFVIPLHPNDDS